MIKLTINFESVILQSNVRLSVALPYPNFVQKQICHTLVALHCALKSGDHFFDELGIGYYVDKYNTAIICPDLGNSFFVDNKFQNVGFFLRSELLPYLSSMMMIPSDKEHTYCLGISMGAYGAVNWALSEPNSFSNVFLISGVYDYCKELDPRIKQDRILKNLAKVVASLKDILFTADGQYISGCDLEDLLSNYVYSSTKFHLYCGSEDYLSLSQTLDFNKRLKELSIPSSLEISKGSHDNYFWRQTVEKIFSTECFEQR